MKYFTKEWYELCQKTSAHLLLVTDKAAETYSEDYFQQVYNQKLKEWLAIEKEMAAFTFDDIYPKEIEFDVNNLSEDEIREIKASYQIQRKAAQERYIPNEPFNEVKATKQFEEAFRYRQEHSKKILTEEILSKIADIRLFAMDVASSEVIDAVTKYCKYNEKKIKDIIDEYQKYINGASELFDINIIKKFSFHDSTIQEVKQTDSHLSILFDNSGGFTNINEIRLTNYNIIKQDDLLMKAVWLYEEIYYRVDRYELHILLQNTKGELMDFIVSAEDISFINY